MNKVSVYGGLGNQMFQYAFCTALNQKGKRSRISFSAYLFYHHHNGFNLAKAFKLKLPFYLNLLQFFLSHAGILYRNRFAAGFFRRLITWRNNKRDTYNEKKEFEFDVNALQQESVFFRGTWQSELYFKEIEDIIKNRFLFNVPGDKKNNDIIEKINNCNAVSIHIRRGDYLNNHWQKSLAVIKDTTYYIKAMEFINQNIMNPHYFIFSDDMQWVKDNLKIPGCTYINNNKADNSYVDMYLMSLCKHNIIANSTFSWWGAWLNKNENKIIIMPDRWMNNNSCADIFPEKWVKIKI